MITLINGNFQNPGGIKIPNGSIVFQLNVDATIRATPFGFVSAEEKVVFQFDAAGNLIQPCRLWSNEELNPQDSEGLGTYYLVTLYDQNGARLNSVPMWWQFVEPDTSTVDISQMVPVSTVGGNVIFYPSPIVSVSLTAPPQFAVTGSPITGPSGTINLAWDNVAANLFLGGPASGGAAQPTFRAIQVADLPGEVTITLRGADTGTATTGPTSFTGIAGPGFLADVRVSVYLYTSVAGSGGTATITISYTDRTLTPQTITSSPISLNTLGDFEHLTEFLVSGTLLVNSPVTYTVTVSGAAGSPHWALDWAFETL